MRERSFVLLLEPDAFVSASRCDLDQRDSSDAKIQSHPDRLHELLIEHMRAKERIV